MVSFFGACFEVECYDRGNFWCWVCPEGLSSLMLEVEILKFVILMGENSPSFFINI